MAQRAFLWRLLHSTWLSLLISNHRNAIWKRETQWWAQSKISHPIHCLDSQTCVYIDSNYSLWYWICEQRKGSHRTRRPSFWSRVRPYRYSSWWVQLPPILRILIWCIIIGYRNEESVGDAIRDSGLARKDIYVTTKYSGPPGFDPQEKQRFDVRKDVRSGIETSLKKVRKLVRIKARVWLMPIHLQLGLTYVDLYLIHHPMASNGDLEGAWSEFEKIKVDGLAK